MFPGRQADAEDLRFLEHINHKIRAEAMGGAPQPGNANPKALNAPLVQETYMHLIDAFEFFLQRPQVGLKNRASVPFVGRLPVSPPPPPGCL